MTPTGMDGDATRRMTADEFFAMASASDLRAELHDGVVVAMAPARAAHDRAIWRVRLAVEREIAARGLPCETFSDSVAINASAHDLFVPDLLVRCGPRLDGAEARVEDATFLVEVVSDDSARADAGRKLAAYALLRSFSAYLLIYPEDRRAVLHARTADGGLATRLVGPADTAPLLIDPPGLALQPAALFDSP